MRIKPVLMANFLLIFTFIFFPSAVFAEGTPEDMKGWEIESPYNKLYKVSELDNFRATVVEVIEVIPMEGMSSATAITVKESDEDEPILVHICPTWFSGKESLGLKKGDRIKIRGVWAEIEGQDVFLAAKIKKGDYYEFKVRLTRDGTPFWTMSEEQLAKERESD
ncbi:MAG: hypothetical protein MUD09_04345 [Desulfobacterales bacterium]|nr:hypothetical protein [Desulfobacterales bacterium]